MVTLITGRSKSGKTTQLLDLLKNNAASYDKSLLFVPEQFSFSAEKLILTHLKDELKNVTVVSFSSFCNEIKRIYGGNAGKTINDGTRMMFISKAIKQLEGELRVFKNTASTLNSIDTIINAVNELKQAAISYSQLIDVSNLYKDTLLGLKLHDIALIMSTYDALIQNVYIDPIDDLTAACNAVRQNGFFKNTAIYFDGFSGFNGQQYNIIKQALIDSPHITFSFCTEYSSTDSYSVFKNTNETIKKIISIAESVGVRNINKIQLNSSYFKNDSLKCIEKCIAGIDFDNKALDLNNVHLKSAANKYDEVEYIATEIHRLVRTKGYNYRDFAVITGNTDTYSDLVGSTFKKLEVPVYINTDLSLIKTPIAKFLISALKAAKNYNSKEILSLLKTDLTNFTAKEISDLDSYVYLWNIKSEDWEKEWNKNPFGLTEKNKEAQEKILLHLNDLRLKLLELISVFNSNKKAAAKFYCSKLFELLTKCNVANKLSEYIKRIKNNGEYTEAQFLTSSWEAVISVLDNIVDCYGDEEINLAELTDLLERSFSYFNLSGIPQGLDQVNFIAANRSEISDIKVAFVFGLNFGEFPLFSTDSGLFNITERELLSRKDINLSDAYISAAIEENFAVYKALTVATESLYLLYHRSTYKGSICEPSFVLQQLMKEFSVKSTNAEIDNIETKSQAYSVLAENNVSESSYNNIKDALNPDKFWQDKIAMLENSKLIECNSISSDTAKLLYGENSTTSASKVEYYYKCPYAFFIKYGLNINKVIPIDFKNMQRGKIVHYVLESFIKNDLENFKDLDIEKIENLIRQYVVEYFDANVGSDAFLDGYSIYILTRIIDMLVELVPNICEELLNSEFKPAEFEYNISNNATAIKLNKFDQTIDLDGYIDRFDICEIDGKRYVRIIDYKTGGKSIKLTDVLHGLNLQMFIYLSVICDNEKYKCTPAGALYQSIEHTVRKGENGDIASAPKISAVLTDDLDILSHMDPTGNYMPFKLTQSGKLDKRSNCINNSDFKTIFNFVKKKIINMYESILSGEIKKDPCDSDNKHRACSYCDYKSICQRKDNELNRVVIGYSNKEALQLMREEQADGE